MQRRLTYMRILRVVGFLLILLVTVVNLAACTGATQTQRVGTLQVALDKDLKLTASGSGFAAGESVKLVIADVTPGVDLTLIQFEADSSGAFSVTESKRTPNLIKKGAQGNKPMAAGDYSVSAMGSQGSIATAMVTVPAPAK